MDLKWPQWVYERKENYIYLRKQIFLTTVNV